MFSFRCLFGLCLLLKLIKWLEFRLSLYYITWIYSWFRLTWQTWSRSKHLLDFLLLFFFNRICWSRLSFTSRSSCHCICFFLLLHLLLSSELFYLILPVESFCHWWLSLLSSLSISSRNRWRLLIEKACKANTLFWSTKSWSRRLLLWYSCLWFAIDNWRLADLNWGLLNLSKE
jgi:hypothetical protein